MSEQDPDQIWGIFRDQNGRCANCRARLLWDERDIRGRAGGWVLSEKKGEGEDEAEQRIICFRCKDHKGPMVGFRLKTS